MFCAECGTKNESGAQFCENCGHKIENAVVTTTTPKGNKNVTPRKRMSKKSKIITATITIIVILLIAVYFILHSMTKPETIAEKFFNATMSYDADAMYEYLDVSESEFTSKKMFRKIVKNELNGEEAPRVVNYKVEKPVKSSDGLSTTVTITYVLSNSSESNTAKIKLVKDKKKKWLLFDNWKINISDFETVKDYNIEVMKGSIVTIEGVKVDSKYLDKKESNESTDVYSIPIMFATDYNIVVELPIGIKIEDTMSVNTYSSYKYRLSIDNLTSEMRTNLQDTVKRHLQTIYDGVKDKKSFEDIKSNFEYKDSDLTDIKEVYEELLDDMDSSTVLTSITFKKITLNNINVDDDGYLEVYVKATYDYAVSYQSGDETKTHNSDDYDYMYLTFEYIDGEFKLVDASSLNSYFSRYY